MDRLVTPELLDDLPVTSPAAIRSRADLRRLNRILGNASILTTAFSRHLDLETARVRSLRIVELGAGDGSSLLELAWRWSTLGVTAEAELIDRQYLVTEETRRDFVALNWRATPRVVDVMTWLHQPSPPFDVILANLFLHHFNEETLRDLLQHTAARTNLFIACEPRRTPVAQTASRLLWLLGCNDVTRHDAVASVRAGFIGDELSALWPAGDDWQLSESPAGLFSHCFIANRHHA